MEWLLFLLLSGAGFVSGASELASVHRRKPLVRTDSAGQSADPALLELSSHADFARQVAIRILADEATSEEVAPDVEFEFHFPPKRTADALQELNRRSSSNVDHRAPKKGSSSVRTLDWRPVATNSASSPSSEASDWPVRLLDLGGRLKLRDRLAFLTAKTEEESIALPALSILIVFGVLAVVWIIAEVFHAIGMLADRLGGIAATTGEKNVSGVIVAEEEAEKDHDDEHVIGSLSLQSLRSVMVLGCVLLACYCCENWPAFAPSPLSRDTSFMTLPISRRVSWIFAVCVVLAASLKRSKSEDPLNREQTEEWKGWMQVMFLAIHYLGLSDELILRRLMIASFLWLTGYCNYMYFQRTGDVKLSRAASILFRLNALPILLCVCLSDSYLLYYMVLLHNVHFLFTYTVMAIRPDCNSVPVLMKFKLLMASGLVFVFWDISSAPAEHCFGWLTAKIDATTSGIHYQEYLRSGFDHWVPMFGMLAAHLQPDIIAWLKRAESQSSTCDSVLTKAALCALITALLLVWWTEIQSLRTVHFDYNPRWHSFYSLVPIIVYVMFRNLSVTLRKYHVGLLQWIGKMSLELYVLQHHLLLSSNGDALLILLPQHPLANAFMTCALLFACSNMVAKATLHLRDAALPNSNTMLAKSSACVGFTMFKALSLAKVVQVARVGPLTLCTFIAAVGGASGAVSLIWLSARRRIANNSCFKHIFCVTLAAVVLLLWSWLAHNLLLAWATVQARGALDIISADDMGPTWQGNTRCSRLGVTAAIPRAGVYGFGNEHVCCEQATLGIWFAEADCGFTRQMACEPQWRWRDAAPQCGFGGSLPPHSFCDHDIVLAGDSEMRNVFYAVAKELGEPVEPDPSLRHADLLVNRRACNGRIRFLWRPFIHDLIGVAEDPSLRADHLVLSAALWDILHTRNLTAYRRGLIDVRTALARRSGLAIWMTTTSVKTERMLTTDKRGLIREAAIAAYRLEAELLRPALAAVVDAHAITEPMRAETLDGIHYPVHIYSVLAMALGRVLNAALPGEKAAWKSKTALVYVEPDAKWGAVPLLILACVLCFTGAHLTGLQSSSMTLSALKTDKKTPAGTIQTQPSAKMDGAVADALPLREPLSRRAKVYNCAVPAESDEDSAVLSKSLRN